MYKRNNNKVVNIQISIISYFRLCTMAMSYWIDYMKRSKIELIIYYSSITYINCLCEILL
jgi:hypothetical protein